MKTHISEKEQAERISISWRALQEYRKKRLIPFVRLGRRVLYKPADVERALERLTIKEVR
jgi:DNA-binding transcriptional MerR regulator